MTRISQATKDQCPEIYGYGKPEDIPGNEGGVIHTYYLGFIDYDGDIRYCPVKKEIYEWDRNERRKEQQYRDRRSRCIIPSDKEGLKICKHNCDECPFNLDKRIPSQTSMDYRYDHYEQEYSDSEEESIVESLIKKERMEALRMAVSQLNDEDRLIVELYKLGKDDAAIAEVIGKKRSTVQYQRTRIFNILREQLKDF